MREKRTQTTNLLTDIDEQSSPKEFLIAEAVRQKLAMAFFVKLRKSEPKQINGVPTKAW